jgi:V/A-type H+-transporting ATPase subunit I
MSKVEIAGPRELIENALSLVRDTGSLQINHNSIGFIDKKNKIHLETFIPDKSILTERLFLEDLKAKIDELFSYLPALPIRKSYIEPTAILDTISDGLQRHLLFFRDISKKREPLQKELDELNKYIIFLDAIEPLFDGVKETPDLDFIGLTLRDTGAKDLLREVLTLQAESRYELLTSTASDGTLVGLVAVSRDISEKIKNTLNKRDIPELTFPPSFRDLPFVEKIRLLRKRIIEISNEIDEIEMKLDSFSAKWGPIYKRVREWVTERLSLFRATASVFETSMCFFIYGWPVLLKNPPYFQPFELLTRILPLPRYTSFDPTPFLGIFFPIFFGMILGDAGYGLLIMTVTLILRKKYKRRKIILDASRILFIASIYTTLFGILYGEFFGELGHTLFGLSPLFIERRTAIIPMLLFAVTVGVIHILLGSILGLSTACKKKTKREALCRFINIIIILCILALVATLFGLFPQLLTKPIILIILFLTPFLLFTGGLLAPLELLKSIGNIISYARIMAIGLTSVLLAFVANRLAGMTGDIVIGIVVAGMLHLLNIIIGIFSPTIHALRLHYVEFFGKFIEPGGKKFEPLKKEP